MATDELAALADQIQEQKSPPDANSSANIAEEKKAMPPEVAQVLPRVEAIDDTVFDPERHEAGPEGKGVLKADGKTYKRKRGWGSAKHRQAVAAAPAAPLDAPPPAAASGPVVDAAAQEQRIQVAATATAQAFVMLMTALGGVEEARPEQTEYEAMVSGYAEAYRAYGVTDVPPWLSAAMATGMYVYPRFSKPNTRQRIGELWRGIVGKFRGQ